MFLFAVCMGLCCPYVLLLDISSTMGEGCCLPCCCPDIALFGLRTKLRTQENIEVKTAFNPSGEHFCYFDEALAQFTIRSTIRSDTRTIDRFNCHATKK